MHADDMNKLLRGELSAIETYQQALEKERAANMLQSGTVPSEVKPLIGNLAAQQQGHRRVLDELLAKL